MGTISKMAEICKLCPDRDKCDHKKMENCAYIEPKTAMSAGADARVSSGIPGLRETMQINVGGVMTTVYKDEIEKEIYKALREPFMLNYGA